MFVLNEDLSIYATRGDIVFFTVSAEDDGVPHVFKAGDVVTIKIYGKKDATNVVLQKPFPVVKDTETVEIYLTREETKIGEVISKPKDYWYEIVVNDDTKPQTIVGYDEDGAKVFKLFPEGKDLTEYIPDAEDIPFVDTELDMTSPRPLQNQAIARAIVSLKAAFEETREDISTKSDTTEEETARVKAEVAAERARIDNLLKGVTPEGAEVVDIRVGADGNTYDSAGTAVRAQNDELTKKANYQERIARETTLFNLFDGNYLSASILAYDDSELCDFGTTETGRSCLIAIKPHAEYHIKKYDESDRMRVATHSSKPVNGTVGMTLKTNMYVNDDEFSFVAGEDEKYLVVTVSTTGATPRLCVTENHKQTEFIEYGASTPREYVSKGNVRTELETAIKQLHGLLFGNVFDGVYVDSVAVLTDNTVSMTSSATCKSGIIRIVPNTHYFVRKHENSERFRVATCAAYPVNGIACTVHADSGDSVDFVSGENDTYMIVYVSSIGETPKVCVTIGDDSEDFIEYGEGVVKGEAKNDVSEKYYFLDDLRGIFDCPDTIKGGSVNDEVSLTSSDCSVIYNIYDELAARYPQYVTKTKLGEVSGYDYNKYTFNNLPLINESRYQNKKAKIVLVAGIHGYEQGTCWVMAQFFKLLCENKDDAILGFMRRNVVFEVVPVANPYGFAHNQRKNGNGVDINRNFDVSWVKVDDATLDYYGGESAHSETETKLLVQLLNDNLDADYVLDYHNIANGYPLFYLGDNDQVRLCNSVFSALTHKWTNEYNGLPTDRLLGYCKTGSYGALGTYARTLKLKSFTLETPWRMPVIGSAQYDKATTITGMETLVNTIVAILKNL